MLRARQTLEILCGVLEHAALTDFREMDFGAFEMRSYEEMKREPAYLHWIADQTGEVACPGGESAAQFKARMFRAFDALVSNGEDALVICHGGAISNIMARLFPHENRHFYEWQPAFGHGYAIVCSNGSAVSYHAIPNSTGTQ
ncbi:MAG: histidine phosphatase family protein, partial [Christensenellales bacterium]|jgi:alpha-ribazole phosphatase